MLEYLKEICEEGVTLRSGYGRVWKFATLSGNECGVDRQV